MFFNNYRRNYRQIGNSITNGFTDGNYRRNYRQIGNVLSVGNSVGNSVDKSLGNSVGNKKIITDVSVPSVNPSVILLPTDLPTEKFRR